MSSLNKAFIKAYHKSQAEAAPKAPARAAPARPATPIVPPAIAGKIGVRADASVAEPPAPRIAVMPEAPAPAATAPTVATPTTLFDAAHTTVRPPHANFSEPRATHGTGQATTAERTAKTSTAEVQPVVAPPIILPMPAAPPAAWRPVYEVTSFTWPELTDQLLIAAPAQFRAAANDLIEASRRHRKLVAVTSAHRGEGCTAVALALAKALVEQQQQVILVDGHFTAPSLADSLGLLAQVGWEDHLSGDKPLAEALIESLEDHLTVLPLRQAAADDWRVGVGRLKASFDELRRHCDVVLIDAGPLGAPDDRRHVLSWAAPCRVDRALVVRDVRTATEREAAELDERLHGCGIAQWHFVENFSAA